MKIGVIDTENNTLEYLKSKFDKPVVVDAVEFAETVIDIAENATNEGTNYDAIAINIEGQYENANRSALKGIELIYWLRLKHNFTGAIISYGFLSLEQIMKKYPQYTVLFAKGNQHFTLGVDTNKETPFTFNIGDTGLNTKNLLKSYTPHIKNLFSIDVARHEKANWWAIKTLWDIHNITIPNKDRKDYPQLVKDKLKILNNYLTTILFRENVFLIEDYVKQLVASYNRPIEERRRMRRAIEKAQEDNKSEQENSISRKKEDINLNDELIALCEKDIEGENNKLQCLQDFDQVQEGDQIWLDFREKIKEWEADITEAQEENTEIQQEIEELKRQDITLSKEEKEEIRKEIREEENEYDNEDAEELEKLIKNNKEAGTIKISNVLLIDDMASDGWKDLYDKMFPNITFHTPDPDFDSFQGGYEEKISSLKKAVTSTISKNKNIQTIILDIRLFPEDESNTNEELSGFQLLTDLNEQFPGIPVMITTASNKIWTFKDSLKKGADGYWMKEGLDNFFTKEESLDNYIALTETLKKFDSEDYKSLHQLRDLYNQIDNSVDPFWWENHTWDNFEYLGTNETVCRTPEEYQTIAVGKDSVKKFLTVAIQILRRSLQTKDLFGFDNTDLVKTYQNSVVLELGKIIEQIHSPFNVDHTFYTVNTLIWCIGDFRATPLHQYRNVIAHNNPINPNGITNLTEFLVNLSYYLLNPVERHHNQENNQEILRGRLTDQEGRPRLADQERRPRLADQERRPRLADQERLRLEEEERLRLEEEERLRLEEEERLRLEEEERLRLEEEEKARELAEEQEKVTQKIAPEKVEQEKVEQKAKDTKEVELIPETPSISETGTEPKEKSLIKRIYNWFKHLFS